MTTTIQCQCKTGQPTNHYTYTVLEWIKITRLLLRYKHKINMQSKDKIRYIFKFSITHTNTFQAFDAPYIQKHATLLSQHHGQKYNLQNQIYTTTQHNNTMTKLLEKQSVNWNNDTITIDNYQKMNKNIYSKNFVELE